jgi:uncharacterized protein (DUF2141 family)
MNQLKSIVLFVVALVLLTSFINTNDSFSLTIEVTDLRNSKGLVQFALYNKDGTITDEDFKNYYKISKAQITKNSSVITFNNIPKGEYAINVHHDENNDGKINKGFILPTEGIGFSNFQTIGFTNRPNIKKASFNLIKNMTEKVKMIYL